MRLMRRMTIDAAPMKSSVSMANESVRRGRAISGVSRFVDRKRREGKRARGKQSDNGDAYGNRGKLARGDASLDIQPLTECRDAVGERVGEHRPSEPGCCA